MAREQVYAAKRIQFFGRKVLVCLQNVNGPCPLLAIANVLSLRNQLKLPPDVHDVGQERLVTMVADLLLDASRAYEAAAASPGAAAHAAHAVSECLEVLSRLSAGIDVNVKFHGVHAFEPTREVAVFDLLGIPLVHGWLVDAADEPVAAAVFGNRSYNELVELLPAALSGGEVERISSAAAAQQAAAQQLQPPSMTAAAGDAATVAAAGAVASAATRPTGTEAGTPWGQPFVPASFYQHQKQQAAALADAAAGGSGAAGAKPTGSQAAMPSTGAALLAERATGSGPAPGLEPALQLRKLSLSSQMGGCVGESDEQAVEAVLGELVSGVCHELTPDRIMLGESPTRAHSVDRIAVYSALPPSRLAGTAAGIAAPAAAGEQAQPPQQQQQQQQEEEEVEEGTAAKLLLAAEATAAPAPSPLPAPSSLSVARDAAVVLDFLERHCSQLTPAGLTALAGALREHQLAVFFRNNHFSTLFKYEGALYLLVTDQGYASEADVVWERLDAVDGNTALCDADFREFVPHAAASANGGGGGGASGGGIGTPPYDPAEFEAAADVAAAVAAVEAAEVAERARQGGADTGAGGGGRVPQHSSADADFALALQLQLQEEEAVAQERLERQRRQQAQQASDAPPPASQQQQLQLQQAQLQQAQLQQAQLQHTQLQQTQHQRQQQALQQQHQAQLGQGGHRASAIDGAAARLRPVRDKVEEKCSLM